MIDLFAGLFRASLGDVTGRLVPLAVLLLISAAGGGLLPNHKRFFALGSMLAVVWAILCPMMFGEAWTSQDSAIHLLFVVVVAPCYLWAGGKMKNYRGAETYGILSGTGFCAAWLMVESGSAIFAAVLGALAGAAAVGSLMSVIQKLGGKEKVMMKHGNFIGALSLFYGALVFAGHIYGSLSVIATALLALAPLAGFALLRAGGTRVVAAASTVAALGVAASGCSIFKTRVTDKGDDAVAGNAGVNVALSAQDMAYLASHNPTKVRIRVFAVVDGQKGDQEGNDSLFDLVQDSATYKVEKVKLGLKEFEVSILNEATETVGSGSGRHLVKPGLSQMEPISIKLIPPEVRRRNLDLNLFVQVEIPGEQPKTTYVDVKNTILQACAGCHTDKMPDGSPKEPKGGLILTDFPYVSVTHPERSQDDLVYDMVYWMKDPTDPMPPRPDPRVPTDKIDLIEKWRTDGLIKFPSADQSADLAKKIRLTWKLKDSEETGSMEVERTADPEHPFPLSCSQMVMKGSFELKFEIFAIDGSLTHTAVVSDYILPEGAGNATFEQVLTIPYSEPVVDVPVVVTR